MFAELQFGIQNYDKSTVNSNTRATRSVCCGPFPANIPAKTFFHTEPPNPEIPCSTCHHSHSQPLPHNSLHAHRTRARACELRVTRIDCGCLIWCTASLKLIRKSYIIDIIKIYQNHQCSYLVYREMWFNWAWTQTFFLLRKQTSSKWRQLNSHKPQKQVPIT